MCASNEFIHDIFMLLIVHIYEHLGAPKSNLCDFEVLLLLFAFSKKKKAVLKAEAIIQHNLYPDIMACLELE